MAVRSVVCPVHVGRDEELALVRARAASIRDEGRTLLIAGEAGVGKSRMAAEAARAAEDDGLLVLAGACVEGASAAYAPVVGALRHHTRVLDASQLADLFAGQAQLAASLLPEVAAALGIEASGSLPAEHLHSAIWHLFARLGAERPTLLLLEDLHWAGTDTLRLVTALAAEAPSLPLWLVATYRVDELHRRHPLTPVLTRLRRERNTDEVRLQPLGREQLRLMLSRLFDGTEVGDDFVETVLERTGGNPFFVEEVCAVLVERGDIFHSGRDWERRDLSELELPETVRDSLLARVQRLDEQAVALLTLAAIGGEQVNPPVLAAAADVPQASVDRAIVEGLDHQLLVEQRGSGTNRILFRHALTREALADELVGPARQHAHRRLAEALVAVHGGDLDVVAAEVCDHFMEAGDTARAREYALRAARRAAAEHAPAAAVAHYDTTLRLLPLDGEGRLPLLLEAAAAAFADADSRPGAAFAREARALAAQRGDRVREAQAMRWLWEAQYRGGESEASLALRREALELIRGRDDWTEASTRAALIRALVLLGGDERNDEARRLLPAAIEVAERAGHAEALSSLHNTRALAVSDIEESRQAFDEAVAWAQRAGSRDLEAVARSNGAYTALWTGDLRRARDWSRDAEEIAERFLPGRTLYIRAGLAWALSLLGEADAALQIAGPLIDSFDVPTRMVALTAAGEAHLLLGHIEEARGAATLNWSLAQPTAEGQRVDPALSHLLRLRLHEGLEAADDLVERLLSGAWTPWTHAFVSPDVARALADAAQGERLDRLMARLDLITSRDGHPHNQAALSLSRGLAVAAHADHEAARTELQQAAHLYRTISCPAREAEALLALAEVEWRAGRAEASGQAVDAARAIAERLGSPPLVAAAQAAIQQAQRDVVLATVLVTDIVGSTERAAALGDRAWRAVLERHHAIVRRLLAQHRGREVDTAGDGFLAAFDSPARAIRCARAVVDSLRAAGIEVRAGLHTGECEVVGDKLAGIAVHTAARVAAAAQPGEVLVSATVRELVAGSGIAMRDRGAHTLRGVPGAWRLYAADPDTAVRASAAPPG